MKKRIIKLKTIEEVSELEDRHLGTFGDSYCFESRRLITASMVSSFGNYAEIIKNSDLNTYDYYVKGYSDYFYISKSWIDDESLSIHDFVDDLFDDIFI